MQIVSSAPDKGQDLIEFFASRSERARNQDEKIRELKSSMERLETSLKRAHATIDSQKVIHCRQSCRHSFCFRLCP